MPRGPRGCQGGMVYHALNRGNCRVPIFETDGDYLAFLQLLEEGRQRTALRVLAYCLMPNHWHLVLGPQNDADLSSFFRWVCTTHVRRWRRHRHNTGEGHLYQGRFKSFPIQRNEHLWSVLRYVEANPLRAKLVGRAEDWPYSSLGQGHVARVGAGGVCGVIPGAGAGAEEIRVQLDHQLAPRPADWLEHVNRALPTEELERLHLSLQRGRPYGSLRWTRATAGRLGLGSSLRNPGRPRKMPKGGAHEPNNV